ncbi:unnamed protein product, partial [Rotaria sp. Silwood2]
MGNYSKVLSFVEKALAIRQKLLPSIPHPDIKRAMDTVNY